MDTVVIKNVTAIALTIKKLQQELKDNVSELKTNLKDNVADLRNRNKLTAENSKIYNDRLKVDFNAKLIPLGKKLDDLQKELSKIDIKGTLEIEALQKEIKALKQSINDITLLEGKPRQTTDIRL